MSWLSSRRKGEHTKTLRDFARVLYPRIFACLGKVIGLYGLLYLEVARAPEKGCPLAAVGLAGKVLGPTGLLYFIWSGTWPVATLVLCLTNDFIWWAPFGLYLYGAWPIFRRGFAGESAPRPGA